MAFALFGATLVCAGGRFQRCSGHGKRLFAWLLILVVPILVLGFGISDYGHASGSPDASQGRFYPSTGHTLDAAFVPFYDSHGGVPVLGYPIGDAHTEGGYLVQWTERERLEFHPEYRGSNAEVLLGLLGRELTKGRQGPDFAARSAVQTEGAGAEPSDPGQGGSRSQFFPQTGQTISEPFLSYWWSNGGLAVFGYPISALFADERGLKVQWFERARFELHPELPERFRVSLGLLGLESKNEQGVQNAELEVVNSAAPHNSLEIGLAQGGESASSDFFDNVRQMGSDLGPGLVRLDNIYDFYHVVSRGEDGKLTYNWTELDQVIESIRAMNKEPFICLSYMPETMSVSGKSRVEPPRSYDEWAALVRATVTHLNVERGMGVHYWEVWNEPNIWDFWQGSFENYLRLYDVTVQAALAADPTISIGGPAFSNPEKMGLSQFMNHEAALGTHGRVDFISWHAYGATPDALAAQIQGVRAITALYPQFQPELMITEFNVMQGGSGDTSAGSMTDKVDGAISLLNSIETMQRERLDRAFLFELKDGTGPSRFWGRWGALTNDGFAKPIYYALKAYQQRPGERLPVYVKQGPKDGTLGILAYGGQARSPAPGQGNGSLVLLWYTGSSTMRVKIAMPLEMSSAEYSVALFDELHNNPARSGDTTLRLSEPRSAGDLVFEIKPDTLIILTSIER